MVSAVVDLSERKGTEAAIRASEDVRQGVMGPPSAFIQKPFSSKALAHKLRALLDS